MDRKRDYQIGDQQNILSDQSYEDDESVFAEFLAAAARPRRSKPAGADTMRVAKEESAPEADEGFDLDDIDLILE